MVLGQTLNELCDITHPRSLEIRLHVPCNRVYVTRLGTLQLRLINRNLPSESKQLVVGGRYLASRKLRHDLLRFLPGIISIRRAINSKGDMATRKIAADACAVG
jgi:hypothetical protein